MRSDIFFLVFNRIRRTIEYRNKYFKYLKLECSNKHLFKIKEIFKTSLLNTLEHYSYLLMTSNVCPLRNQVNYLSQLSFLFLLKCFEKKYAIHEYYENS